jgi:hypothetical protein
VDLLVWGTVENLLTYRFAAEFLSEDRFQSKIRSIIGFRLAGHKGVHSPGGLGTYRSPRAARQLA